MPVCWDVGIVEDQIVPGPLEQPMGAAGDVHSRKGCRELLIRRPAKWRWVVRLQRVCVLVSVHLLEDGFSGKGFRHRRHGIMVHPLVGAMTRQVAISVSYPRTIPVGMVRAEAMQHERMVPSLPGPAIRASLGRMTPAPHESV